MNASIAPLIWMCWQLSVKPVPECHGGLVGSGQCSGQVAGQVKLILKCYKYPPDMEARAIELVLKQVEALSESFV